MFIAALSIIAKNYENIPDALQLMHRLRISISIYIYEIGGHLVK
jgi:hypothetical protein